MEKITPAPFTRTKHPEAQWFPDAGFGLFMHWGIHSVAGLDPSWAMKKNIPWYTGENMEDYQGKENYYRLARQFNPQRYDPNAWMEAARRAGMTYAVLTAKHHDGFGLWPSEYGQMSTRTYLDGRDLLQPFVAACRKYGRKVGFYFSGPDWSYPGRPVSLDNSRQPERSEMVTFNDGKYARFVHGQLSELLTLRQAGHDLLRRRRTGFRQNLRLDSHSSAAHCDRAARRYPAFF